jgi:hypothetical protein
VIHFDPESLGVIALALWSVGWLLRAPVRRVRERVWAWRQSVRAQRWARQVRPISESISLSTGELVGLQGQVHALVPRRSPRTFQPAVVCAFVLRHGFGAPFERGGEADDFDLALKDGTVVRVHAAEAAAARALIVASETSLVAHSPYASGLWCQEIRVAPGDEVEVVGRLGRELDASEAPISPRHLPVRWAVRASGEAEPLMVTRGRRTEPACAQRACARR